MGWCRYCTHWEPIDRETARFAECGLHSEGEDSKVVIIGVGFDNIKTEWDFGCEQFGTYLPPLEEKALS